MHEDMRGEASSDKPPEPCVFDLAHPELAKPVSDEQVRRWLKRLARDSHARAPYGGAKHVSSTPTRLGTRSDDSTMSIRRSGYAPWGIAAV